MPITATSLRSVVDLVLPQTCAGCGAPGTAWCATCGAGLSAPVSVPGPAKGPPRSALSEYTGPARRAVLAYKERGRRVLADPLGGLLARALPTVRGARPDDEGTWQLVPVPSTARAARGRGGPHVLRLARHCAAHLARDGRPAAVVPALRLDGSVRDSVGLDATQRAANLHGAVHAVPAGCPPSGTPVVLLDDVITTGATASVCTEALAAVGLVVTAILALATTTMERC